MLTNAGFADFTLEDVRVPMYFGEDADDAYRFVLGVSGWMADGLDDDTHRCALEALRSSIAAHATPEGVQYESAAWIVTAARP